MELQKQKSIKKGGTVSPTSYLHMIHIEIWGPYHATQFHNPQDHHMSLHYHFTLADAGVEYESFLITAATI
jgi:hypothetical protein